MYFQTSIIKLGKISILIIMGTQLIQMCSNVTPKLHGYVKAPLEHLIPSIDSTCGAENFP